MSDKNSGIKNLIEAHSWLGVIISVALFIVFWAGAIALFRPEIVAWAQTPHFPQDAQAAEMPIEQVVERKLKEYPLNNEEHLTVLLAGEERPYHHFYIDLLPEEGPEVGNEEGPERVATLLVDPVSGETLADINDFYLADFLFRLHYDLRLPGGTYLVGLVTLVFLVLIFTGITIHARKLVNNFFLYREKSPRNRLLDTHNVVGVISLPFGLMYALTGLIFNLAIVYQIAFAVFLYDGNRNALLEDAGYTTVTEKPAGKPLNMSAAYQQMEVLEKRQGHPLYMLRFYNYGDENAVAQFIGRDPDHFAQRFEQFYRLRDGAVISEASAAGQNAVRRGLDVVRALHFGSFAGIDLRTVYFLLGLAVAGMILAGNLLWLDKRALQKNVSPRAIRLVGSLTLGSCAGVVVATAAAFLAERIMPLGLEARGDWLARTFATSLLLSTITAFAVPNKRRFLCITLWITSALMVLTVAADWVLFGRNMDELQPAVIGVETVLLIAAGLSLWIAGVLGRGGVRSSGSVSIAVEST